MKFEDAINQILSRKEKILLTLCGCDLYTLTKPDQYERTAMFAMEAWPIKDNNGKVLPPISIDRIEYFKSVISSEKITVYSGRRYKQELFSNEILLLIVNNIQAIKEITLLQNLQVNRSDFHWLKITKEFLELCDIALGNDLIEIISKQFNADYKDKEVEMWKDLMEEKLEICEADYSGITSAYNEFINSFPDLTFKIGEEWFFTYVKNHRKP